MSSAALYSEVNLICILFLVLMYSKLRKSMSFRQDQKIYFARVIISMLLLLSLDAVWVFINEQTGGAAGQLNRSVNTGYFILTGLISVFWFEYSENEQDSRLVNEKRYRKLYYIPVALLILLTLVSWRTGWLFYIDGQNCYHRGPAYAFQLVVTYGYVLVTALKAFYLSFHTDDYRRKVRLRYLAVFILPSLVAGSLQVLLQGYPILCVGNTFGILYVYLSMQEQMISLDPLTRLNNRNQLYQYLSARMREPEPERDWYLMIMDIDYFKSINDKYGHVEGDRALIAVADCLMELCRDKSYFIARYGGDEFVVICEPEPPVTIQDVCDFIQEKVKAVEAPYQLALSIGFVRYTPEIRTQQELIDRADRELYKVKEARSVLRRSHDSAGEKERRREGKRL